MAFRFVTRAAIPFLIPAAADLLLAAWYIVQGGLRLLGRDAAQAWGPLLTVIGGVAAAHFAIPALTWARRAEGLARYGARAAVALLVGAIPFVWVLLGR